MKNSELFWTVLLCFFALALFTGLLIVKPKVILILLGLVVISYIFMCLLDMEQNYVIPLRWNIFERINNFLNSFPQIIKNKDVK